MARGFRRFAFWLVYVAGLIVLIEGSSYVALNILDNRLGDTSERHWYNPIRGHELNPNYRRAFDTDDVKIHSDQGFRRDGLIDVDKPKNTFRIFVMGGSTLYGIGVQDDFVYPKHRSLLNNETVTYYLEQKLNAAAKDAGIPMNIEVINAGVVAYQTFQHVLYFYETLYAYNPDAVLFLDGQNDFYRLSNENPIKSYGYSSYNIIRAFNERRPFITIYAVTRYFGQYSYFFKLLEKMSLRLFESFEGKPRNVELPSERPDASFAEHLEAAAHDGFLRNYRLIDALSIYYDFSYHVFLQPEVVFEDPKRLTAIDQKIRQITVDRLDRQVGMVGDIGLANMIEMRAEFPKLFESYRIPFTDIGTIADTGEKEPPQLYVDYCHLTAAGSAVVAERMFPAAFDIVRSRWDARKDAVDTAIAPATNAN